jgi:hypothetical protein
VFLASTSEDGLLESHLKKKLPHHSSKSGEGEKKIKIKGETIER